MFPGCYVPAALGGRLSGLATVKALAQQEPEAPCKPASGHTLGTGPRHLQLGVCADCTSTAPQLPPRTDVSLLPWQSALWQHPAPDALLLAARAPLVCVRVQVTKRSKAKVQARRSTVKTFIKVGHTNKRRSSAFPQTAAVQWCAEAACVECGCSRDAAAAGWIRWWARQHM